MATKGICLKLYSSNEEMLLFFIACGNIEHHTHTQTWPTSLFMQTLCLQYIITHATFCTTWRSTTHQYPKRNWLGGALRRTTWKPRTRFPQLAVRVIGLDHLPYCISTDALLKRQRSTQTVHRPRRRSQFPRLNTMNVTMLHTSPQLAQFFRETVAYRSRWFIVRTESSSWLYALKTTTNVYLDVWSARKKNTRKVATTVPANNLLQLIAIHPSPSLNQNPLLLEETIAGGRADGYTQE